MRLVTLVKFRHKNCSQRRAFSLSCPRAGMEDLNDIRSTISSETRGNGFVEEEFLCKKTSKKDVYVDCNAMDDISQVKLQLSSTEIWQHWSRWNKLLIFLCKPAAYFWIVFTFSPWFWWECKTWFIFSLHALTPSFCNFVSFSLAINFTQLP